MNQLNNPDKMSPTLYLSIEDIVYEGMTLLWVYVPPTSTVEKCANRIYDRNEDGDMDITDSPIRLQNMYNRKATHMRSTRYSHMLQWKIYVWI